MKSLEEFEEKWNASIMKQQVNPRKIKILYFTQSFYSGVFSFITDCYKIEDNGEVSFYSNLNDMGKIEFRGRMPVSQIEGIEVR